MDPAFQSLFVDPVDHAALEFDGSEVDGRWVDGWLVSESGSLWPVRSGVPEFVRQLIPGSYWGSARVRALLDNGQYERNWLAPQFQGSSPFDEAMRRAAAGGAPIIDVATGPGGGAMPFILRSNPQARVLATDGGTPVVHGWREYLGANHPHLHVSFASFDLAHMPFGDDSVDVITSVGGFSNVFEQVAAWREAARVLRPGGRVLAKEGYWDPEGMRRLAEALGKPYTPPLVGEMLTERIRTAGFRVVEEVSERGRLVRADDNDWSRDAVRLGIEVWFRFMGYVLTKG